MKHRWQYFLLLAASCLLLAVSSFSTPSVRIKRHKHVTKPPLIRQVQTKASLESPLFRKRAVGSARSSAAPMHHQLPPAHESSSPPFIRKRQLPSIACLESPLFRKSAIGSRSNTVLGHSPTNQSSMSTTWKRPLPSIGMSLITVCSLFARPALALSTVSLSKPKHVVRTALRAVALWLLIVSTAQQIRVKKRQALDATSEWGRYAAHPGARGRAVLSLSLQILPFWLAGFVWRTQAGRHYLKTKSGKLFSTGLLQLGPLYIKLGQIVSCREHLLPQEWKVALERLQDRVPARSGQDALDLAYASIGSQEQFEKTFSNFTTTPLAAASLGQVHKAVLRSNNDTVAVKIQRPYLREIYDEDFALLIKIANIMDRFFSNKSNVGGVQQSWTDIFADAKEILYREIDYRDEADNAIRFSRDFGLGKNGRAAPVTAKTRTNETLPSAATWLRTPYVYRNVSSEKVLVMEYVPSIKITDSAKLDAANVSAEEREYLADTLARSYLRQFCVNKFFSTDPHPGNLGVERFNGRPRLVFYDFGQACELNSDQADGILDVIEAIVDSDADRCVEAFETMGVLTKDVDVEKVRAKVQDNFEKGLVKVRKNKLKKAGYVFSKPPRIQNTTTTAVNATNTTEQEDSDVMQYFTLPAEYAFVARAISQMDGVGKTLDPDFDFISSAAPNIVEIKGATVYLRDEFEKFIESLQERVASSWDHLFHRGQHRGRNETRRQKREEHAGTTT